MKNNTRLLYVLIILLVIWNIVLTVLLVNKDNTINQTNVLETEVTGFSTDLSKVVDQVKSSVVTIETNVTSSTGFIYKSNKDNTYVITTCHSVDKASLLKVIMGSGASYEATVVGKDIFGDVAVLQINPNVIVTPVNLGNSDLLNDGEFVVSIGTPKSQYAFSSKLGIISSKLRTISNSITVDENTYDYYTNLIQLSSDVSEGYSGSALFNMNGEVMGMITMKDDNAVFALPINEINYIANNIINGNEYSKIQFGVRGNVVSNLENYEKNQLNIPLDVNNGLYVSNVRLSSLGYNIGIKQEDIIISINNVSINSYSDLLKVEYTNADLFEVVIVRNNEEITLVGSIND